MSSRAPSSKQTIGVILLLVTTACGVDEVDEVAPDAGCEASVPGSESLTGVACTEQVSADQDPDCPGGPDCAGTHAWSKGFDGPGYQSARGVAVDSAGDLLVVGYYAGWFDLGGDPLPAAAEGDYNGFVAKLDPHGRHLWSRAFVSAPIADVAIDGEDNVILAAHQSATLMKLDPAGDLVWSKAFPAVDAMDVAVGPDDSVVVTGSFRAELNLGGDTFPNPQTNQDMFIVRYAPDGEHLWSRHFGDFPGAGFDERQPQEGIAISMDAKGRIVVAATVYGEIDFGDGPLVSHGWSDVTVAAFTADGEHLWSGIFGGPEFERAADLVALDGGVVVTGTFNSSIDFGLGEHVTSGLDGWPVGEDMFVVRFDPLGQAIWSLQFGTPIYPQEATSLARDGDGVVLTGSFRDQLDFGGDTLVHSGALWSMFVARLDGTGAHTFSRAFSGPQNCYGDAVAVTSDGPVVVGAYSDPIDFGGGLLPMTDPEDYANVYVLGLLR
jgi:hypothetical protein